MASFAVLMSLIVLVRHNCSPCFAYIPVVSLPNLALPNPVHSKNESSGQVMVESEEKIAANDALMMSKKTCIRVSTAEDALNVFMKRCPLSGNRCRELPSFAEHAPVLSVPSNVSGGREPVLEMGTLSGPDAGGTDPISGAGKTENKIGRHELDPARGILEGDGPPATEDMPSFNEWAKKRLEEQGIPSGQQVVKGNKVTAKKNRHKNYASVDCGAKVLTANAESQSASAVLSHDQDDYMLNPCTARAWLVLELCEAVQLERLELANFELFASSPRHFNVHSSDHFPTRDWNHIGTFEAMDEKTAQSFSLHQTSFSKYVKVELVSHYGAEHFCPLSLIRVYGTSEYEALDTEEQVVPDDQSVVSSDDVFLASKSLESKNIFGSAKEAVLTIVKKAAAVLSVGNTSESLAGGQKHNGLPDGLFSRNCRCLLGSSDLECRTEAVSAAVTACNLSLFERALSALECNYNEFSAVLRRFSTRGGNFLRTCFSACAAYVDGSCKAKSSRSSSRCHFYAAALGPVRFGALCLLGRLNAYASGGISIKPLIAPPSSAAATATMTPPMVSKAVDIPEPSKTHVSSEQVADACAKDVDSVTSPIYTPNIDASPLTTSMEVEISGGVDVPAILTAKMETSIAAESFIVIHPTPSSLKEDTSERTVSSASQRIESSSSSSLVDDDREADRKKAFVEESAVDSSVITAVLHSEDKLSNGSVSGSSATVSVELQSSHVEVRDQISSSIAESTADGAVNSSPLVANVTNNDHGAEVPMALPGPLSSSLPMSHASSNGTDGKPMVLPGGIVGSLLTPGQKESVFVRLSNRIKALELNMSLSGQYLEELSRRYRKQMEEMQRAFNKTINALNETARMAHERDLKQQEVIGILQNQLDTLSKVVTLMVEQQEGLHSQVIARHLVLMMVEIIVMMTVFFACFRPASQRSSLQALSSAIVSRVTPERTRAIDQQESARPVRALAGRPPERRSSDPNLAGLSPFVLLGDRRRPSSEALNVSGTYSDLLIIEPTIPIWMDRPPLFKELDQSKKSRRKKHRNKGGQGRDGLYRSVSNDGLASKPPVHPRVSRKVSATDVSSAAGLLFDEQCAPRITDIPVDKNCDDGFDEESLWTTATATAAQNPMVPVHRPAPQVQSKSDVASKPWEGRKGSCPLNLPLSFNLKEASLAATSLVYCNGRYGGKEGVSSLAADDHGADPRREGYRLKKVSQKVY